MKHHDKQVTTLKRILSSKLILVGSLILLIFISIALGKAIYRRHAIQQEIQAIRQEIEKAEGKNKELSGLIGYFSTDAFKEKMARQKLNLQREGETVVAIPVKKKTEDATILGTNDIQQNSTGEKVDAGRDNPRKWWYYFFSNQ
ncbi:MAG: septum formation initiator family protein [Patescibacteria group bacterium]|nr:septum formation initiator family protein [Patescibacteria group bacterium]